MGSSHGRLAVQCKALASSFGIRPHFFNKLDYDSPRGSFSRNWKKNKIDKIPDDHFWDTFFFSPDHTFQRNKKIILFFCYSNFFYSPRTWFESEFQNKSTKKMLFLFYFPLPTCVFSLKIFFYSRPTWFLSLYYYSLPTYMVLSSEIS